VPAFSEKPPEDAIREISLKLKSTCGANIQHLLLFFTSQYPPLTLIKSVNFTLKPHRLFGLQVPALIYGGIHRAKGVLAIAVNNAHAAMKEVLLKSDDWENTESTFRRELRDLPGEKSFMFSALPPGASFANFRRGVNMAIGKNIPAIGAGYMKKFAYKHYVILNNRVEEGIVNLVGRGLHMDTLQMGGFVPLGKPFVITKSLPDHGLLIEINNRPAIEIYRHYFQDKFENFKKRRFFPFYPIGVHDGEGIRMISVADSLKDGSLLCLGSIKEGSRANFTILHQPTLFRTIKERLETIRKHGEGFVFMINSISRKKILMDAADEELLAIKTALGDKFKTAGICADYIIYPDKSLMEIGMETGNLLLSLWK